MKTISVITLFFIALLLSSCQGEQGPPGMDGLDGAPGESSLGTVFQMTGTFSSQNNYTLYYSFPSDLEIYDGRVNA